MALAVFTTRNCTGYQFTEKILEFKFGTEQFEQDLSEWETQKTKYERQAETALPDSILVTTLLSRTTGTLQQHLRMNMRLLDTYDTVRNVITKYHQSRHVTGFESPSDTGPSPMEIGGVWQRKGMKGKGKSKEKRWFPLGKGKGRRKYPFGPLTGTGKSKGGMGAHTEKRKASRPRCWNGMMTSLSTVVKTGKIGLDHVPTTGVIALTMTGHSWTGMVTRTGTTLVGMTTGPGVLEVTPLTLQFCRSLSDQLHPAVLPQA